MQELQRSDIIRGIPARDSRETLYRVTDRVFVYFYRLRQGNQLALKTPLDTILDFLRAFYSRDEQRDQAAAHLAAGRPAEARLFAELALEGVPNGELSNDYISGFGSRLERISGIEAAAVDVPVGRILEQLQTNPEMLVHRIREERTSTPLARAVHAIIHAQALARMGLMDEAEQQLQQQLDADQEPAVGILIAHELGVFQWNVRRDPSAARRSAALAGAAECAELPLPLRALVLRDRAWVDGIDGNHEQAIASAREAADLAAQVGDRREQAVSLRYAAWSLGQLGRHDEAVSGAREAADLAAQAGDRREQAELLRIAAWSLARLGRHDEAISGAREAADLAAQAGDRLGQAVSLRYTALSLGRLGRHDEAIAGAREAADLHAQAGDRRGQAESLWIAAWSLDKLERHQEALSAALEGFDLAVSVADAWSIDSTAREAVKAAMHIPSPEAVSAFARWAEQERTGTSENQPDWKLWVGEAVAAAARASAWDVLDALIEAHPDLMAGAFVDLAPVGATIARIGAEEGRAAGFESARNSLRRLARLWDGGDVSYRLTTLVSAFAKECRDPGLLRDIAGLLTAELAPEAAAQADLLHALADLDQAADPQAILARADPDLALWMRRIRDLPEPKPKPRRRKTRGG